jgi:hypothetical protein
MIRPIDLQNTIIAAQNTPAAQRTDQSVRTDNQAAQAAFAAQIAHEQESVAATSEATGNRIGAKSEQREKHDSRGRATGASASFEEVVDDAAGSSEEPAHIIDFTA